MKKRVILAIVAVFVLWSILDFIIHGVLLKSTYEATASLWRPQEEMKMLLMQVVVFAHAICFVAIYGFLVADKSFKKGIKFGALVGLAAGITMGFGMYCYMPIPVTLAWGWFLATLVEATAAGAVVGLIMVPRRVND